LAVVLLSFLSFGRDFWILQWYPSPFLKATFIFCLHRGGVEGNKAEEGRVS